MTFARCVGAVVFALACTGAASAAERCNAWLEPGDFDIGGHSAEVRKTLGVDDEIAASWVALPGFRRPEYAVSLERDGERWTARYAVIEKPVRGKPNSKPPTVHVRTTPLAADLARRVVAAWKAVIDHPVARTPAGVGRDGQSYVLSVDGARAHTWSPDCGVPLIALQSAETLADAVKAKTEAECESALRRLPALLDSLVHITASAADASH